MKKPGKLLLIFLMMIGAFLSTSSHGATLKVETEISDFNLELGDQFTFTVTVVSDEKLTRPGPKFKPPKIKGLDYMGVSESSSTGISINNFKRSSSYKVSMRISYACMKEGIFKIPSLDLDLPGGLKTKSVSFKVFKKLPDNLKKKQSSVAGRRRSRMDSLLDQFMGNTGNTFQNTRGFNPEFFAEVELDKTEVYEGEQLIATWYVYLSDKTSLTSFDTLEFPTLRGFWKEDVSFASRFYWKPVIRDGKRYVRSVLSSYALTPYNAGDLEIDSFKLRIVASQQSFFNQKRKVIKAESKPAIIKVKPLPTPVPPSYFGGVGRFKVDTGRSRGKKEVLYGESFVYRVRIIGDRANTKFIKPPKLDLGKDFKVYSVDEENKFIPAKLSSYKDIKYSLVPRKEGLYTIPDAKVSFLDPATGEYYDAYLKLPMIKVLPNKNATKVNDEDFWDEEVAEAENEGKFETVSSNSIFDDIYFRLPHWFQFSGLFIVLILLSLMFRFLTKVDLVHISLLKKLEERTHKAAATFKAGGRKEALEELINVYSLLIGGVSGKRFGMEEEFSKASENLPPSLKSSREKLMKLNEDLQELRFGSSLDSKENQVKLQGCLQEFQNLFSELREYLR